MEEEKLKSDLKQRLQAGRGISLGKEKQGREMQRALEEKAVLGKQWSELAQSLLGTRERNEPKGRPRPWR